MYAGAPGEPPLGSKHAKALDWLRRINLECAKPFDVLGRIIEVHMEENLEVETSAFGWSSSSEWREEKKKKREKIERTLAENNLRYLKGGKIIFSQSVASSRTLEQLIADRDIEALNFEFERALINVEANPREAVSAASNILESLCKVYIEESPSLQLPAKLDLKSIWAIVRKDLGFDPSHIEDQDLQKILTGLFSIIDGIASLRSHASTAHGAGKKSYKLEPRHTRLAVHSAHTAALFILETWEKRKTLTSF